MINIYFNHLTFENNIWKLFILFDTALIIASFNSHKPYLVRGKSHINIVQLLLEQEGIDSNAKNV